ncbi:hypothetical protein [Streptomyces pseudogriseolus]|uniref:hypothetical protein n=1 Tax=Streptomyces pseudogriseolus TaxID=36817 RepID=UPI003FA1EDBE
MLTNPETVWPEGVVARYLTVGGATVDITHGNRTYPTSDGIGENRNHTTVTCTGCSAAEEFSHWRVVKRMTFDDKVRDTEAADRDAREWAQEHAEKCRAMPRREVNQ